MPLPSHFVSCPGLFYKTSARDGILSRIRIPGGILSGGQCRVIADLADEFGTGYVNVTNRANLQVREIRKEMTADVLRVLQEIGIASAIPEVDHLRNIMGSPTAGIDPYELIDTRALIRELDNYITTHAELAPLSPKFSVAFDGGGSVSIGDRLNDIVLTAVMHDTSVYFRLKLNLGASLFEPFIDTGILLKPEECLEVVATMARVYLQHLTVGTGKIIPNRKSHQLRLWEVLNNLGVERFLQEIERCLPYLLRRRWECRDVARNVFTKYQHIGVHPQRLKGLSYIGVVIPVGKLETWQMRKLADIAETYGSGTLRLTPWQNLLISDIPQQWIPHTKSIIENLGLHWSVTNIRSALVACAGNTGCASSATDTKGHALALAKYLDNRLTNGHLPQVGEPAHGSVLLNQSVNIHFTGCQKSCAQHSTSDIALLGVSIEQEGQTETVEGYKVYVGDGNSNEKFGRELYQWIPFAELPQLIERMLQIYMAKRANSNESFGEFANRYAIADLQRLFEKGEWLVVSG
ncbi:precorrin-3B synthase [Mastigocladopsis repens]|uniref:precorrin-3B synthase n=1 Tax=Mastigocladopsis repens TaxID=221287 RepID=UPI0002DD2FD6|nr:precorrin-3B synthase [Mastigocladopsis repens]